MKGFRSIRPGPRWPWALFGGILLLAALLRLSHVEIAHFQLDQSRIAHYAWELAREGVFRTHMFALTSGYNNFPLSIFLYAPPFLLFSQVHALLLWNIGMNLVALTLCWQFARRYWGWPAAAIATLLLATAPWDAFYAARICNNTLMPLFVMAWACSTAFAYHERRPRWWPLSWAVAAWLFQLHPGGVIFLIASGLLSGASLRAGRPFSWRSVALGLALGLLPALPWLGAHLSGATAIDYERLPFYGEGKRALVYNWQTLVDFLSARHLGRWFRGDGLAALQAQFAPLDRLAPIAILYYAFAGAYVLWQALRAPERAPYRVLAPWLLLPLAFPVVSYGSDAIIYYLPLLPAPFLALAAGWSALRKRWRALLAALVVVYCALSANAIWQSARFVRMGVARDDAEIWAVGGGAPLSAQLAIATAAREVVESGEATEIIHLVRPIYTVEYETLTFALPLLSGMPARILSQSAPHIVYPAAPSVWFMDTQNTEWPTEYAAAGEAARVGQYRLYILPGGVGPMPKYPLPERPAYANGLQLLGYDALLCNGNWQLHWTPGPTGEDGAPVHFFAHLLDEDGNVLAQRDVRSYDHQYWRDGDHIITNFDFGPEVVGLPVEIVRIGLYSFLDEMDSKASDGNYILDERGRLWVYWGNAVDLPYREECPT